LLSSSNAPSQPAPTLIAARRGARVTGVDIATNSIEAARGRAASGGLDARFDEGDAEVLPYPDASFDVVASIYGAMFAPRPERVAAELLRVCRPGGTIAMGNWTKEGFIGKMFKTFARFISICCGRSSALPTWPPAPTGSKVPNDWWTSSSAVHAAAKGRGSEARCRGGNRRHLMSPRAPTGRHA
jgi:SAM-dependent methyltransferase